MSSTQRVTRNGLSYWINWTIVERIVRNHERALAIAQCSTVESTNEREWYLPTTWSMPTIRFLATDWIAVRTRESARSMSMLSQLRAQAGSDVLSVQEQLKAMVAATETLTSRRLERQAALEAESMRQIMAADTSYENEIAAAKWLLNSSASTLMVGATVLSGGAAGGAAVGMLAGGSAMTGIAKWTESETLPSDRRIATALITGVGTFMFGAFKIPGGRALSRVEDAVLIVLKAQVDTAGALVEGKSMGDALSTGATSIAGAGTEHLFKSQRVLDLLKKVPVPVSTALKEGVKQAVEHGVRAATKPAVTATTPVMSRTAAFAPGVRVPTIDLPRPNVDHLTRPPAVAKTTAPSPTAESSPLLQRTIFTKDFLLPFAIVREEPFTASGSRQQLA